MAKIDIGGLVGAVVKEALTQQAAKPTTEMTPKDVAKVEPAVTKAVEQAVAPVVENLTNSEPWYKSRILRGAAWAICTTAYLAFTDWNADGVITNEALGSYVSALAANAFIIYGRLTSSGTPVV